MHSMHFNLLVKMSHVLLFVAFIFITSVTVNCHQITQKEYYQTFNVCSNWCQSTANEPFQPEKFYCCSYKEKDGKCPKSNNNVSCSKAGVEFECIHDFNCPYGFKCCFDDCFWYKICKPIKYDERPTNTAWIYNFQQQIPKTSTSSYSVETLTTSSSSTLGYTDFGATVAPSYNENSSNEPNKVDSTKGASTVEPKPDIQQQIPKSSTRNNYSLLFENLNITANIINSLVLVNKNSTLTSTTSVWESEKSTTPHFIKFGATVAPSYNESSSSVPRVNESESSTPGSLITLSEDAFVINNTKDVYENKNLFTTSAYVPSQFPTTEDYNLANEVGSGENPSNLRINDFNKDDYVYAYSRMDDEDYYDH